MAAKSKSNKSKPVKDSAPKQVSTQPASANNSTDTVRNAAVIFGLLVLVILAGVLVAFMIAGISGAQQPAPNNNTVSDNTEVGSSSDSNPNSKLDELIDKVIEEPETELVGSINDEAVSTSIYEDSSSSQASAEKVTSYTFGVEGGDSMSWIARRAMYAYMEDNGLGLDAAQRLYFEVSLTNATGVNAVYVGQEVTFSTVLLADMYQQTLSLSPIGLAAWNDAALSAGYF